MGHRPLVLLLQSLVTIKAYDIDMVPLGGAGDLGWGEGGGGG